MPSRPPSVATVTQPLSRAALLWLWGGIVVVGILIAVLTVLNFTPVFRSDGTMVPDSQRVEMPAGYDYGPWRALAVQHRGRYKPFETAAQEVMREVSGRSRLQGKDAVAVVLMWMLEQDAAKPRAASQWEKVPFILCEHEGLRSLIYRLQEDGTLSDQQPPADKVHGKYISPADLREFRARLVKAKDRPTAQLREQLAPLEQQFDEAFGRLAAYDSVRQGPVTSADERPRDPLAFVALDKVKGSPWFSVGDLRYVLKHPEAWQGVLMKDRVKDAPQMYVSPEHRRALEEFQASVKAGDAERAVAGLEDVLKERRTKTLQEIRAELRSGETGKILKLFMQIRSVFPHAIQEIKADVQRLIGLLDDEAAKDNPAKMDEISRLLDGLMSKRDAQLVKDLRERLPARKGYDPDDPKFRMLHLTYLETRFPDVYQVATAWQPFPEADARHVVKAFNALGAAYRSHDAARFAEASQAFMSTVKQVSEKYGHAYPGEDSIADRLGALVSGGALNTPGESLLELERTFNLVKPFMWGWILMLVALVLLVLNLGLDSRWLYRGGLLFYAASLLFQLFGFFTRIVISGRPPVTNMYETVIWVAFMSGIFALILEAIYRRKVIAVAGALVSTISLVLADQLPLALDPKINPLVPVLRSNFWLTIHVLTIVSSYAAGALAWGLGNISLVLLLFASNKRETIKTLSHYTYRALQIAVLLLASGTFLGGWWAAYSWGRFWGWDPKETGALIALLCYVIPLHMRYIGWIKDFGLAVAAILCFAAIMMSWYGINFWIPAGLHSYGFGGGGVGWVFWASLINIEWVLVAGLLYIRPIRVPTADEMSVLQADSPSLPEGGADTASRSEHVKV
jgi:ABC-type transport system involved in cytochrome c biogenesis permease subunit